MTALYFARAMLMTVLAAAFLCQLTESRYDSRRTRLLIGVGVPVVMLANLILFLWIGWQRYIVLTPLLLNLPLFLPFVVIARRRGFRVLFTILTDLFASYIITLAGMVCALPFGGSFAVDLAGRLLVAALFLFLFGKLRPLYLSMQEILSRGWALFCLIPLAYYASAYALVMRVPPSLRGGNLPYQLFLTGIVVITYIVIFFFFQQTRSHADSENERQLLKVQVAAYEQQSQALVAGEQELSALRHDIRHYIRMASTLLHDGQPEEAALVLEEFEQAIPKAPVAHWCDNPALNVMLSYYLRMAQQADIQVEARLDLPEELPVGSTELSIVFANAIENAVGACRKQGPGEARRLVVNAVASPQLSIEIANTYAGDVRFGRDGLPVAAETGHGIGTRSIWAFAQRHGAMCSFAIEDGMFYVRLLLPKQP